MEFENITAPVKTVLKLSENETIQKAGGYIIHEYKGNKKIHYYDNPGTVFPLVKGIDTALTVFAKVKMYGKNSAVYVLDADKHEILNQEDTKAYIKSLGFVPYIAGGDRGNYAVSIDIRKAKFKNFMPEIKTLIDSDPDKILYRCVNVDDVIRKKEYIPNHVKPYSLYLDNDDVKAVTTPLYCFSSDKENFSNFGIIVSPGTVYSLDIKELKMIFKTYNVKATYNKHDTVSFEKCGFYANPGIHGLWVNCK